MTEAALRQNVFSREEQRRQKRLAVLRSGARLFRERGFERTSLEDIADDLKVSKRTLYYYVDSKDEILFECSRLALELMEKALHRVKDTSRPAIERIEVFLRSYAELVMNDFGACLVTCRDDALSEECREVLREGRRNIDSALRSLLEEGIEDQTVSSRETRFSAAAIFGAINWTPYWYRPTDERALGQMIDQLLSTVLNGIRPRKS